MEGTLSDPLGKPACDHSGTLVVASGLRFDYVADEPIDPRQLFRRAQSVGRDALQQARQPIERPHGDLPTCPGCVVVDEKDVLGGAAQALHE